MPLGGFAATIVAMILSGRLRSTLGVVATTAIVGCFSEAGDVAPAESSEGTGTSASSAGSSSDGPGTTSADAGTSGDASSSSAAESSSSAGSSSSADGSSSTGDAPIQCECPPGAIVCEGFEGAGIPAGWTTPTDVQPDPTLSLDAGYCGEQGLSTAVGANDLYSVLISEPAFGDVAPGPTALSMRVRLTPACLAEPTRALAVSLLEGVSPRYELRLRLGGDEGVSLQFVVLGNAGPLFVPPDFGVITPDVWHEIRIDFDGLVSGGKPTIGLAVDDDAAVVDVLAVPDIPNATYDEVRLALGPYRFETPFAAPCEILYDDVWFFLAS